MTFQDQDRASSQDNKLEALEKAKKKRVMKKNTS